MLYSMVHKVHNVAAMEKDLKFLFVAIGCVITNADDNNANISANVELATSGLHANVREWFQIKFNTV